MPSTKFLLAGCQAASSGPDQQHSQTPVASVSSVQPAENLPADALLTDGLLQPCLAILLGRIAVAAERAAAANERIAAAVEQVATIGPYLTSSSSVVPAVPANTPTNRQKQRKKRGRTPDTDPEKDRRISKEWKNSGYKKYEEFARKNGYKIREVKTAVDRDRHRNG